MSQTAEINKQKLLEAIRQGRWSEQRPKTSELKKARYMDVLDKTPPMRIDQIAQVLNGDSKKTGGILAQYRKMMQAGTVKIIWFNEDPSKLPYVVRTTWFETQKAGNKT